MSIRIKIRNQRIMTISIIILLILFENFLESCGLPHSAIFIADFLNLYLLLEIILHQKLLRVLDNKLVRIHFFFMAISMAVSLFNGTSITLILWSARNLFRFYVFYGACILFLSCEDVKGIYAVFEKIFYLNAIMMFVQYLTGYRQDSLGGIFGVEAGANAYNNVFLIIVCSYNIARFLYKKQRIMKTGIIVMVSLIEAVVAEIKVFLFELVFIVLICVIFLGIIRHKYKVLFKGTGIGLLVFIGILVGTKFISKLYPSLSNSDFLSIEGLRYILTRTSGYTGYGDLNRLTAIGSINQLEYFNESVWHRIFGMGLGAAEYSSTSQALQSVFYKKYADLHYYWFSHAWMYLECGYMGLIGYVLGFWHNAREGMKRIKLSSGLNDMDSEILTGIVVSLMTLPLYIYNQSLRLECAYLLYFAMSVIFIGVEKRNEKTVS